MEFENNIVDLFKFSYSWALRKEGQKLFAKVLLGLALSTILMIVGAIMMTVGIILPLGGFSGDNPGWLTPLAGLGLAGFILGAAMLAAGILVSIHFSVKAFFSSLREKGLPVQTWNARKLLGYVVLYVVKSIYVGLSILSPKGLLIALAFYASIIAGFLFPLAFLLTLLLVIPYIIVVVYNLVRLSAAYPLYLSTGKGIFDSMKRSNALTKGKVLPVFGFYFGVMLVWGIVVMLVNMGLQAVARGLGIGGVFVSVAVGLPVLAVLSGLLMFAGIMAVSLLTSTFNVFATYYLQVGVYEKLLNEGRGGHTPKKARK